MYDSIKIFVALVSSNGRENKVLCHCINLPICQVAFCQNVHKAKSTGYERLLYVGVFVLVWPFQPSLMFVVETGA